MEISLSLVGLALIIVAWLVQIVFTAKNGKAMRPCFAGLQFFGIALLVVDMYQTAGMFTPLAWLNVASAAGALVMVVLLLRK